MGTTLVRWLLVACVVGAGACEGPSDTPPDSSGTDGTDSTDDTDIHEIIGDPEVLRLAPPEAVNGDYAATSLVCADCHSNSSRATALRDAAGRGVAPYDLWRGSMMAHSSRDPIYRAAVAAEMHHVPSLADTISKTCTTCHAPVAWAEHTLGGEPAPGQDVIQDAGDRGDMARDGASCVGCHLQTDDADGARSTARTGRRSPGPCATTSGSRRWSGRACAAVRPA